MKILVTGGAGFIGSNFVRYFLQQHPSASIINVDKLTYAGNLENLIDLEANPRYRFVRGDITDAAFVDSLAQEVEAIIHFAAETHVDRSIVSADAFVRTNVYGTYVLLEASRRYQHQRFVHISTDEVYGSRLEGFSRKRIRFLRRALIPRAKPVRTCWFLLITKRMVFRRSSPVAQTTSAPINSLKN